MRPILTLDDSGRADLVRLLERAASFGDGAVRLVADGDVVLVTTPMTSTQGLLETGPTVLAARAMRMRYDAHFDGVVTIAALRDALREGADIEIPSGPSRPAWSAVSPPRSGWIPLGEVPASAVRGYAASAAELIAAALPDSPGEPVRRRAERAVWGEVADASGLTFGQAAALIAMRFVADAPVRVFGSGGWVRASALAGDAIAR